jgi:hypothetical protein
MNMLAFGRGVDAFCVVAIDSNEVSSLSAYAIM